jgi:hypothetical protein
MMTNKFVLKISPILWQLISLTISISIFSLILANRSPNILRPISMALRTGFGLVIPVSGLILYLAFRIPNRAGELIGMTATLSLFAMPLAGFWASGQSQSVAISGLIPLADAASYYTDSLRILSGLRISHFSAMRPFFAGFLSFLMSITNRNFMLSLAMVTALAAIAIYYSAREIQRTHGAETAVFLLIILFLYFRNHSGTSMSETLGVPLGALGIGLVWRGIEKHSQGLAIFGLFMAAFALNVRPGAMFTLPFILLWLAWIFKKTNKFIAVGFLLSGIGAVILSFALNSLFIQVLAGPSGTAFSNFSWALYGLASGGHSFNYVFQQHPEVSLLQDPQQSQTIYRLALDLMIHSPNLLIKGLLHNWSMFFSDSWYSAFSFLGGENGLIYMITRWAIYILSMLGFLKWIKKPNDPYSGLVAIAAFGVLASVPFVPPTDANRVRLYAASIMIFALLPSMGLSLIIDQFKVKLFSRPNLEIQASNVTVWFSAFFIMMILGGTLVAKASSQPPPAFVFACPADNDKIAVRFNAGTSVNIIREKNLFLDWMPNFHQGLFNQSVHGLADMYLIYYLEALTPNTSIFSSLDYLSNRHALIIIHTDQLPPPGTYIEICGHWETDPNLTQNNVFFADSATSLNNK